MSLFERDGCVSCNSDPQCNCGANEQCILTSRTCSQCPTIQCNKNPSSSGGGINPGAIAGPVVAALVIISLALFWWLRRKKRRDLARLEDLAQRARKAESAGFHLSQPGSPVPNSSNSAAQRSWRASRLPNPPPSATTRSSQRSPLPPASVNAEYRDDNGTTIRVYKGNGTINLDPKHPDNGGLGDPFADKQSISTNGSSTRSADIIPIQFIPPSNSDGVSQAAKTLDEARQNLFRPQRPARSPDLDLRLSPSAASGSHSISGLRPANIRDSYLSSNSVAPSFLSGASSYDVYDDAPKIFTSKQVHVGRYQQAEVVQLRDGHRVSPAREEGDPFRNDPLEPPGRFGQEGGSPRTFGSRSLTPTAGQHEADMGSDEPSSAGSTDLRFSMGSLAYRDSVSTMGTSRYLARPNPDSAGVPPPKPSTRVPRESTYSNKSYADSVLSGYPMIPPGQAGSDVPPLPTTPSVPKSTSNATLDHLARTPKSPPPQRPMTQASIADSFLGTFPFVPPNMDDLADLPSAALPTAAVPDTGKAQQQEGAGGANEAGGGGRNTLGMSVISEGLGGFDFKIGDDDYVPPVPRHLQK